MESVKFLDMLCSAAIAGSVTEAITFPFDTAKVRMQTSKFKSTGARRTGSVKVGYRLFSLRKERSSFILLNEMRKEEGFKSWYRGLSAGIHRQIIYAGLRISSYPLLRDYLGNVTILGTSLSEPARQVLAGVLSGALSIFVASPADLVKVRLQAQEVSKQIPRSNRSLMDSHHFLRVDSRCSGVLNTYRNVIRNEGFLALWRGLSLNIARNSIFCSAELVGYDQLKTLFVHYFPDNDVCHAVCGFGAGCLTSGVGTPVDVIKTRIMNSTITESSRFSQCVLHLIRSDGVLGFYRGFFPNTLRLSLFNMSLFFFYEQVLRSIQLHRKR